MGSRGSLANAAQPAPAMPAAHALPMLAQRCAKAYAQSALNLMPEQSRSVMQQSQLGMTASLAALRGQPAMRYELQRELTRFDTLLTAAPARRVLLAVAHQSNVLQDAAERDSQPDALHALATLSQRLAKNYFLSAQSVDSSDTRMQLFLDQRAFKLALQAAEQRAGTPERTRRALALAQGQWAFYEVALQTPRQPASQQQVASASEKLWELFSALAA